MTNKQERWFVCNESELDAAIKAHREAVARSNLPHWEFEAKRAEAACRARPISLDRLEKLEAVVEALKEVPKEAWNHLLVVRVGHALAALNRSEEPNER